ncbi:hypothetical protein LCGC14_0244380 [marine sediment metagenome]|uniref:Uncharacterized protein n=1 Tax=marine sediment metagenome TaxID=412755 RepID=A0A0F9WRI1_9ZZZZ
MSGKTYIDVEAAAKAIKGFDCLHDFPLTPGFAKAASIKEGGSKNLWVFTLDALIQNIIHRRIKPFEFNRGTGDQFSPRLIKKMVSDFCAAAFGQITGAVFKDEQGKPYIKLADGHNRTIGGLMAAYEAGVLSASDLRTVVSLSIVPATEFQQVYSILNTNRSHNTGEKTSNPLLRYGDIILDMAIRAGIAQVGKTETIQLAYIIEYLATRGSVPVSGNYSDVFPLRSQVGPQAGESATVSPVGLSPANRQKIIAAMQWIEGVCANVDKNSGAIPLKKTAFIGLLMMWHVAGKKCLSVRSTKIFAAKLNKHGFKLDGLIPDITSGKSGKRERTEERIEKLLS